MPKGQKFGGRQKGTPNKVTAEVKALAMKHTPAAIRGLAKLAKTARSEMVRVAAWREILDRAVGRPAQSVDLTNSDGSLASAWAAAKAEMDQMDHEEPPHVEH